MLKMRWIPLIVLLAGCAGILPNSSSTPGNIENACSIVRSKPLWRVEMRDVERKWGTPTSVQMAIIYHESSFRARARTPMKRLWGIFPTGRVSSAYGYAQALDGTWNWYRDETGRRFARRDNFGDAVDFIGWYNNKSNNQLGISKTDTRRLYLAYHEGHTGYKRGSYNKKPWLLRVAGNADETERKYREQLRTC